RVGAPVAGGRSRRRRRGYGPRPVTPSGTAPSNGVEAPQVPPAENGATPTRKFRRRRGRRSGSFSATNGTAPSDTQSAAQRDGEPPGPPPPSNPAPEREAAVQAVERGS